MSKLVYLLAIIGGFVILYSVGRQWQLKPETKYDHRLTMGESGVVKGEKGATVWLAEKESDGYAVNVAMVKKDAAALKGFEEGKKTFAVDAGTPVTVRGEKNSRLHVEVRQGPHAGRQGWVEHEYVRPRQAGERQY